jgi:hypothetical protein
MYARDYLEPASRTALAVSDYCGGERHCVPTPGGSSVSISKERDVLVYCVVGWRLSCVVNIRSIHVLFVYLIDREGGWSSRRD